MATKTKGTQGVLDTGKPDPTQGNNLTTGLSTMLAGTMPQTPSTQTDINQMLAPYMKELTNLGPEYAAEMEYLKPYLSPEYSNALEQSVAKQYGGSGVQAPAHDAAQQALNATETQLGNAAKNMQPPGFGDLAGAAKQYAGSIPYQDILQSVLMAGKNEILGYSTIPNLTNVNTSQWPAALQGIMPYLEQSIGVSSSGIATPQTLKAAGQGPQGNQGTQSTQPTLSAPQSTTQPTPTYVSSPSLTGGGAGG